MSKTTIALLLFSSTVCRAAIYRCLDCEDLNRSNLIECHLNYATCGECKLGVGGSDVGEVSGVEGQSIELPCEFNAEVDCFWEKNGQRVTVEGSFRFRFKSKAKGILAKDCALVIERLSPSDVDDWRCATAYAKSQTIKVQIAKQKATPAIAISYNDVIQETKQSRNTETTSPINVDEKPVNALHVYWEETNVDGRVISMDRLRSNGSAIKCQTEVEVDELRWEINGRSILKTFNAKSIRITTKDLEKYFYECNWSFAKVYCVAANAGYTDSYVFIINSGNLKAITRKNENPMQIIKISMIVITVILFVLLAAAILFLIWCLKNRLIRKGDAMDEAERKPFKLGNEEERSTKFSFFKNPDIF